MKKVLISLIVLVALFISGCSDKGTLTITNWNDFYDAWFEISGDYYDLPHLTYWEDDWDLSTSIFGDEEKSVSVEIGGEYIFNEVIRRTVKPGSTAKIDIDTNAGEIVVYNESYSFYIEEVYISPSDDTSWGDNDLSGTIGPGNLVSWYVTPGFWDVKVVDDWGDEFWEFDIYIGIEDTYWFYYDGFKSVGDSNELKIANAKTCTQDIEDRVQQNDK
ncbi:MAG: hypothetical protein Q7J16_02405 [Candidatus Cloacimonadales bacterium]|nr:hypothetical protein [Candidatus Cloacimonadales bacterium]